MSPLHQDQLFGRERHLALHVKKGLGDAVPPSIRGKPRAIDDTRMEKLCGVKTKVYRHKAGGDVRSKRHKQSLLELIFFNWGLVKDYLTGSA